MSNMIRNVSNARFVELIEQLADEVASGTESLGFNSDDSLADLSRRGVANDLIFETFLTQEK